jgi:uncharacterized membrane protein
MRPAQAPRLACQQSLADPDALRGGWRARLALIALAIDSATDYDLIPQALTGPEAVAQTMLTTFIGALVTLISIVITVAVQLAMQQFSPWIVRPLLKDRRNHVAGEDVIASPEPGAVYGIEYDALVEEAPRADVALELVPAMGDFVVGGAPLVRIHGP